MGTSAMPVTNVLGELVRRQRMMVLEISQDELGRRLGGFTRQFVHAVERGIVGLRTLEDPALRSWARVLRISVRELKKARQTDALARVRMDGTVGSWLRWHRIKRGCLQKDVARAAGCSPSTLSRLERNRLGKYARLEGQVRRALHDTHPR